jgi:glutamate formiminotransferase
VLECVVNVSEGRSPAVIADVADACGTSLLDVHSDQWHNRSVFTLGGSRSEVEAAARALASNAVARIDLDEHEGVHPRFGVVDVVPFVPLGPTSLDVAVAARDAFAAWLGSELGVPCFLYGPQRSLPEVRRLAFARLAPDTGPSSPHPTAGACAVGARPVLVAWNLWLAPGVPVDAARAAARMLRARWPGVVRALGLDVGGVAQVSCNLVEPLEIGPAPVYDAVAEVASIDRAELVGLAPEAVLAGVDRGRWAELDLSPHRTIEARLAEA